MTYKRILLKLSGEALMGEKNYGIDNRVLRQYAEEVKTIVDAGVEVAIVIGGGNTAMDCARTSFRLGAEEVYCVAPEKFHEMLASPWEKEDAIEEHVNFRNSLLPYQVKEENKKEDQKDKK